MEINSRLFFPENTSHFKSSVKQKFKQPCFLFSTFLSSPTHFSQPLGSDRAGLIPFTTS